MDGTENRFSAAYNKAKKLFPKLVSRRIKGLTNGYDSFFVGSSGSKEWWPTDDEYQANMKELIEFLEDLKYEDGSTSVKYVYITFGELGLTVKDYMGHDLHRTAK